MSPVWIQIINSIVRAALMFVLGWFVSKNIITEDQANQGVNEFVTIYFPILLSGAVAAYGAWKAKKEQHLLLTAQALPAGVTTKEVLVASKSDDAPPVTLKRDEAPRRISRVKENDNA